jgi:hypothetical protein
LVKRAGRALVLVVLVLGGSGLTGQASARADDVSPGTSVVSRGVPFEAKATRVARVMVGGHVSIECEREAAWRALGSRLGFDPVLSWAVTPFHWSSQRAAVAPDGTAYFSPQACRFGAAFWLEPSDRPARNCQAALERLRDSGELAEHALADCDVWASRLTAVHVLSHESVHLFGFYDEAQTDCVALQLDARVAAALGADDRLARSMAREYLINFHLPASVSIRAPSAAMAGVLTYSRHDLVGRRRMRTRMRSSRRSPRSGGRCGQTTPEHSRSSTRSRVSGASFRVDSYHRPVREGSKAG